MRTAELDVGQVIDGRYRVLGHLGTGGMARVLLAEDEQLGRRIALKVFTSDVADGTDGDGARRRDEVRLLAGLSHPGLVTLFDAVLDGDPAYLTMELVPGETLHRRLARGPLGQDETRATARTLADALAFVHARGIVHRDVKPGNVLLPDDELAAGVPAKLADFGIARLVGDDRRTITGTVIGTAAYLSPEQARGDSAGPPSDVYALGLLMIESLTGRHPFPGSALESAVARLARRPDLDDPALAGHRDLLDRMTATDADARPTAAEVAAELSAPAPTMRLTAPDAATVPMTPAVSAAPVPAQPAPSRRGRMAIVAGAALASVLLGVLAIAPLVASIAGAPPVSDHPDRTMAVRSTPAPPADEAGPDDPGPGDGNGNGPGNNGNGNGNGGKKDD